MGKGKKEKVSREFSAGGVVFKREENGFIWLLINPSGTDRWQFPKGHLDGEEGSKDAAVREVFEETGIKARLISKLGTSQYFFVLKGKKIFKIVSFFLMEFISGKEKKPDIEIAEAKFYPYKEAFAKLTFEDDRKMLAKAKAALGKGIQGNLL